MASFIVARYVIEGHSDMMSVYENGLRRVSDVCLDDGISSPREMRKEFSALLQDSFTIYDFFANYVALGTVLINLLPDPPWSEMLSIMRPRTYPIRDAIALDKAIVDRGRLKLLVRTLKMACPKHPWFTSKKKKRVAADFIDTLNSAVDMLNMAAVEKADRTILALVARENDGSYAGHIFVTCANKAARGDGGREVRGVWPFGITRSLLHLPGACTSTPPTSGFVDALMRGVLQISREQSATHIFSWPRKTMLHRFLSYGFKAFTFGMSSGELRETAEEAIRSVLTERHATNVMENELQYLIFVLKEVDG